jgi:hypothetical protein
VKVERALDEEDEGCDAQEEEDPHHGPAL